MSSKLEIETRIINLAKKKFFEDGYKNLKTSEIAAELGISKRTIYEHFKSKEDIAKEIIRQTINDFNIKIEKTINLIVVDGGFNFFEQLPILWKFIEEHVSLFNRKVIEDIRKNLPDFLQHCTNFEEQQEKQFKMIFYAGLKNGYFKESINIDLMYLTYFHTIKNLLTSEVIYNLPLSVYDVIKGIYEILLTGTMTEKGQKQFEQLLK